MAISSHPDEAGSRLRSIAMLVLLALGVAFLARATLSAAAPRTDFNYYWLAGWMWGAGEDPYGPLYYRHGIAWFAKGYQPVFWSYPPHWLPLAWVFSRLPVGPASYLWSITSAAATVAACVLLGRAAPHREARQRFATTALLIAYLGFSFPLALAILFAQVSLLLLLGVALIAWGMARERTAAVVGGTLIVLLKPNFGIPIAVSLALVPGGFRPAAIALGLLVLLSLPALLITPPRQMLAGLAHSVAFYETFEINSPVVQTGLANLVLAAGGPVVPGTPLTIGSMLSSALLLGTARLRRAGGPGRLTPIGWWRRGWDAAGMSACAAPFLYASIASSVFINRLHSYDMVMLVSMLPFLIRERRPALILGGLGALLIFHPNKLRDLLAIAVATPPSDATLASLGALAFYLAACVACLSRPGAGSAR